MSRALVAGLLLVSVGCGSATSPPDESGDPAGIWRSASSDGLELMLELSDDGSYEWIEADLVAGQP